MITITHEDGEDKLPIDNLSREELMNRVVALENEAIKDDETYVMVIEVC